MSNPKVSVIMPVYNTAPYLGEAISSILNQSFPDFEFIIINDGSIDESEKIISKFSDPRIIYVGNSGNKGLVYTLNRGLDMARGEWIARMDSDDISAPDRFEEQLSYLKEHPEVDVLATRVQLITDRGLSAGIWDDDERYTGYQQIIEQLPRNNCIAHPSIMARASVLKQFRYLTEQSQAEDYDLWLRLAASGKTIHKLDKALLKHRIINSSFTRRRQQNVFQKLAQTKFRFVAMGRKQNFDKDFLRRTYYYACIDLLRSWLKIFKRRIWGTGS